MQKLQRDMFLHKGSSNTTGDNIEQEQQKWIAALAESSPPPI